MLDIIAVIIILFNILLMIYAIRERNIAFCVLSSMLWLVVALFMFQGIEVPYELFNGTSGNIETGVHVIQANLYPLAYLFMLLSVIMIILTITFAFELFTDYKNIKMK